MSGPATATRSDLPEQTWTLTAADVAARLGVDPARGLDADEAVQRSGRHGNALAVRSERASLLSLGPRTDLVLTVSVAGTVLVQVALVYLPVLRPVFVIERLGATELAVVLVASTAAFVAVEVEKAVRRTRGHRRTRNR